METRLLLAAQGGGEETVFVIVGDVNSRTRGIEAPEARALVAEGKPIIEHDELCSGERPHCSLYVIEVATPCVSGCNPHVLEAATPSITGAAVYGHTMCEAAIAWPPSYKFKKGKYDEKRAPSYCDRVLWDDGAAVALHVYVPLFGSATAPPRQLLRR